VRSLTNASMRTDTGVERVSTSADGELTKLEGEIVALFSDLAVVIGLPRSYGGIYGLLYASALPLSFTDIQEKLALSKGSVSQGMRALREVGAIRPVEAADERREHFVPETELRKLISGFLKESIEPRLKNGASRIETIRSRHRTALGAKGEQGRLLLGRLEKLQSWHRKGGTLLPLVSKFLG
jgi:HTH-type transcriptional regulator, glycine betaine synthesis regulator